MLAKYNQKILVYAVWLMISLNMAGCESRQPAYHADKVFAEAFDQQRSGFWVEGEGKVITLLSDDQEGSRHQRFILRLASGQTLLVSHNIDLASRLESLSPGDNVFFRGMYEWNQKGGVIHWTHHDPEGKHPGGWLKHADQVFA